MPIVASEVVCVRISGTPYIGMMDAKAGVFKGTRGDFDQVKDLIRKENLGELTTITVNPNVPVETTALTAEQAIDLQAHLAKFQAIKKTALPRLENSFF